MAAAGREPRWTITAQREDYAPGPTGAVTPGVTVTFRTASGISGTVFVPDPQYSTAAVKAAVDARAAAMEAVQALTGD